MPLRLASAVTLSQFALNIERSTMSAGVRTAEMGLPTKASMRADLFGRERREMGVVVAVLVTMRPRNSIGFTPGTGDCTGD